MTRPGHFQFCLQQTHAKHPHDADIAGGRRQDASRDVAPVMNDVILRQQGAHAVPKQADRQFGMALSHLGLNRPDGLKRKTPAVRISKMAKFIWCARGAAMSGQILRIDRKTSLIQRFCKARVTPAVLRHAVNNLHAADRCFHRQPYTDEGNSLVIDSQLKLCGTHNIIFDLIERAWLGTLAVRSPPGHSLHCQNIF